MDETSVAEMQKAALGLFVAMEALMDLHAEADLEGNDEKVTACVHCSALADAAVSYPCPTVQVLLTDFFEDEPEA